MARYTKENLVESGYEICNAIIKEANISMEDHGCITFRLYIEGNGWGCHSVLGGYCLGHGYLGSDTFDSSPKGLEMIARVMNVVGVSRFNDMTGKYIRVAMTSLCGEIKIIGNILEDKWFNAEDFFKED